VLSARVGSPGRSIYLFIGRQHGARSFFGWRALCPGRTQLGLPHGGADSRASAGPVGACLTSDRQRRTDTCRRGQPMSTNSGCLPRQTPGALIVTLLVTIQGTARALKHARAPSRPGGKRRGVCGITGRLARWTGSAFSSSGGTVAQRYCSFIVIPALLRKTPGALIVTRLSRFREQSRALTHACHEFRWDSLAESLSFVPGSSSESMEGEQGPREVNCLQGCFGLIPNRPVNVKQFPPAAGICTHRTK